MRAIADFFSAANVQNDAQKSSDPTNALMIFVAFMTFFLLHVLVRKFKLDPFFLGEDPDELTLDPLAPPNSPTSPKSTETLPNPHADYLNQIAYQGDVPSAFRCPITQDIMFTPVRIKDQHHGHVFEHTAIEKWLKTYRTNPLTRAELTHPKLVPANDVEQAITHWLSELRIRHNAFSLWAKVSKVSVEEGPSSTKFEL